MAGKRTSCADFRGGRDRQVPPRSAVDRTIAARNVRAAVLSMLSFPQGQCFPPLHCPIEEGSRVRRKRFNCTAGGKDGGLRRRLRRGSRDRHFTSYGAFVVRITLPWGRPRPHADPATAGDASRATRAHRWVVS